MPPADGQASSEPSAGVITGLTAAAPLASGLAPPTKALIRSIGSGKMIVRVWSELMSPSVWR